MMKLVFVIGKPGSGKSTFIELLKKEIEKTSSAELRLFNDREMLLSFAREELYPDLIRPIDAENFEVLNERIFDLATRAVAERVVTSGLAKDAFAVVEFSRQDYVSTFRLIKSVVDQCTLIVYLRAPLEVCITRNNNRKSHVVPEAEMRSYFREDDIDKLRNDQSKRVLVLSNDSTIEVLKEHVSVVMRLLLRDVHS